MDDRVDFDPKMTSLNLARVKQTFKRRQSFRRSPTWNKPPKKSNQIDAILKNPKNSTKRIYCGHTCFSEFDLVNDIMMQSLSLP